MQWVRNEMPPNEIEKYGGYGMKYSPKGMKNILGKE